MASGLNESDFFRQDSMVKGVKYRGIFKKLTSQLISAGLLIEKSGSHDLYVSEAIVI